MPTKPQPWADVFPTLVPPSAATAARQKTRPQRRRRLPREEMKSVSISMSERMRVKLYRLADARECTVAQYVRDLVLAHLETLERNSRDTSPEIANVLGRGI